MNVYLIIVVLDERVQEACKEESDTTLHRHPSNCLMYIQCVGTIAYERKCVNGLFFNPSSRVCDYQHNVECKGNKFIFLTIHACMHVAVAQWLSASNIFR